MHMQHDAGGLFQIHVEKALEHHDDEFHRRVIVVEQQDFELAWLFGFGAGAGGKADLPLTVAIIIAPGQDGRSAGGNIGMSRIHARGRRATSGRE